ncbi:MAG: serine/threonine-protein kinase, partial [Planctomycetota bacterium]
MKVHCPKCLGTFRIEGEPGVTPFDCPFCKASFSFRDKATIVLASSPLTRVKVEKEETPAEAAEDAASPGSVDEEQSPPLEPATPPPAPEVRPEDLTDLKVGDEVNGYLLEEVVGWGGMSIVIRANQLSLNRNVALKVLRKDLGEDPEFSRRFLKEARALADLSHPNIVQVHDQGVHNGNHYLVMEFIDGVSLRDVMNDHKLVPEEALKIVPALCSALEYAHGRGIIHRDIKPENILLDRAGTPKVADFGLVRMLGESDHEVSRITQTRTIMGTIDYMAPEQRRGSRDIDHRADIYSLGVVLYEMLTGDLPIARFPLPSEKVQVDIRLDEVVLKTLQKDRDRRYQRASLVATDLRRIGEEAPQETPGGRDPSTIGGRLVQMGSSFPFFFFTLVYILVCSVSGEDGAILFFTGLAIPFYLGQLVLHGIMPRPVFPRTSYIYRHPLVSFGLLAVALGILTGNGVLEDELGGMLVGLCISSGLGMALWRHRIFRTSGEPAWLAAPASHGGEPHHRRGPRHWRHRHGRLLRPVARPRRDRDQLG